MSWDLEGKFNNVIISYRGNGIVIVLITHTEKNVICVKVNPSILKHVAMKCVFRIMLNNASYLLKKP